MHAPHVQLWAHVMFYVRACSVHLHLWGQNAIARLSRSHVTLHLVYHLAVGASTPGALGLELLSCALVLLIWRYLHSMGHLE